VTIALLPLVALACGSNPKPSPVESRAPIASATPSTGPSQTAPPPSPTSIPAFDPKAIKIRLVKVAGGLTAPVGFADPGDGSGRLFVIEKAGRIRIIRDGKLARAPFLDIRKRVVLGSERGLLGLAFHPDFPNDPRFFVDYTDLNGNSVISSFTVSPDSADRANPDSERFILRFNQPYANHNGGGLAFGPDGDLYIAAGDGGSAGDPQGNGQRLDTLLGKLLRIQVGAADGSKPIYAIPSDAPFANKPNARPEIRAYGLRNPWRFSFDRATGDIWIGDVGQRSREEVDRIAASTPPNKAPNFGWNIMEGSACYPPSTSCDKSGLTRPITEYGHGQGCAIIGGYVGRDPAEPLLYGGYLFGDNCSGRIWAIAAGPNRQKPTLLLDTARAISSFGEDEAGQLYVVDLASGVLLRIVASPRS